MSKPPLETDRIAGLRSQLLQWYELNQRDLPWRRTPDPYAIWVSEIMLQQTRVAVVIERYNAFLQRFPTLISLADAPEQEVLALWSGLGYYRRARMLHKAAQFVARELGGNLPANAKDLRLLPGIGPYTAAAIASIAHQEPVAVVDGNVERVLCRLSGWEAGSRTGGGAKLRNKIETLASALVDPLRPGDFNQAIMELGATVCTPRTPLCLQCPLSVECVTLGEHKTPARPKMMSREVAHALVVRAGEKPQPASRELISQVLLEQRPPSVSVMPGLWELPQLLDPMVPDTDLRMAVRHAIMQVNYYVRIRTLREEEVETLTVPGGARLWVPLADAGQMALTGLARKVLSRARLLSPGSAEFDSASFDLPTFASKSASEK
jgi:A/G-specific adenine glycosylase